MKTSKLDVQDLKRGQVLLTRVRKIHNNQPDKTVDHLDYKFQIECAEFLDNPLRPVNAASVFNKGDQRFGGITPRRGYVTIEPEMWNEFFGTALNVPKEAVDQLQFSSTTQGDVNNPREQVEGKHFIYLGVLNPVITYEGHNVELHVRVVESTFQRNEFQRPKINPGTQQVQTKDGAPIFSTGQVVFGKQASIFLLSDQMKQAISNGTLPISIEAVKLYKNQLGDTIEDMSEVSHVSIPGFESLD